MGPLGYLVVTIRTRTSKYISKFEKNKCCKHNSSVIHQSFIALIEEYRVWPHLTHTLCAYKGQRNPTDIYTNKIVIMCKNTDVSRSNGWIMCPSHYFSVFFLELWGFIVKVQLYEHNSSLFSIQRLFIYLFFAFLPVISFTKTQIVFSSCLRCLIK